MLQRAAVLRRLRRLVGQSRWERLGRLRKSIPRDALVLTARAYRQTALRRVIFVGITGSSAKTTTKELIAAILSTKLTGRRSPRGRNEPKFIARTILTTMPWHDFCAVEIAGSIRPIERSLGLVTARIGVVTTVGAEHISTFRTVEAIAAEKSKLVTTLPPEGTAVLNADDPLVLAMQARCRARVLTYGVAASATVRAEGIEGRWPDRLSFTVVHGGESYRVRTQLCGVHWVSSVLAALTVAIAMGIPLATAVEAVAAVPPFRKRMSPVPGAEGVTFIRDDAKAPLWSMPLTFQFLKEARASRKIVVIGTISDYLGASGPKYVAVAREALEVADHVVFVGPRASTCLKAKRHPEDDALHAAPRLDAARRHLERIVRPGDLVLLKGSSSDHLGALIGVPIGTATESKEEAPERDRAASERHPSVRVIVGLGNPGETYKDTPHNVGQRALDLVASSLSTTLTTETDAMVARVDHASGTCYLVKPLTKMNATGAVLQRLGEKLGFGAEHCILLQDDVDLPLAKVRTRMSGGDGGHRGVRSVLEAFQSQAACRVKIGVGRPAQGTELAGHVLGAFDPVELVAIDRACAEAASRALELAGIRQRTHGRGMPAIAVPEGP